MRFILIDKVVSLEPGREIKTVKSQPGHLHVPARRHPVLRQGHLHAMETIAADGQSKTEP